MVSYDNLSKPELLNMCWRNYRAFKTIVKMGQREDLKGKERWQVANKMFCKAKQAIGESIES